MTVRSGFLLAGVMGWPIAQSRSPALHNFWLAQHKLAGTYVPLAIPSDRLERALRALSALNFAGCNLTLPLKQKAMVIVDEVDETAKAIGAISCVIVRDDGSLGGTNNDWYGFTHNILEFVPDWRADAGPTVVMGAGGAARAVVYGLLRSGAREIRICNRTFARAQALADAFGVDAAMHEGLVTFPVESGELFVPRLFAGLPVAIQSVNVSRPSLDDVFMSYTGKTIRDAEASIGDRNRRIATRFGRR